MHRAFLRSIAPAWPTDGSVVTMEALLQGVERNREILGIGVEWPITGKSTAATFNLAAADFEVVLAKLTNRFRMTQNGEVGAVDITPKYLRDYAMYATSIDPYQIRSRAGDAIASSAGSTTFYINVLMPYFNVQRGTFPNRYAPSGHQMQAKGGKVSMVSAGNALAGLNAVVLANGSLNITAVGTPRVYVVYGAKKKRAWVAPTLYLKERSLVQNPDPESGYFLPELEFETRDAAALDTAATSVSLNLDGQLVCPPGTQFRDLAAGFVQTTAAVDNRGGYDITKNSNVAGELGRTPILWVPGATSADEEESPLVRGSKTLTYGTQSNGTIVTARYGTMQSSSVKDTWTECAVGTEAQDAKGNVLAIEAAAIKGGVSPSTLVDFYPRWLAPPSAAQ
jgi:hypothetical protein